MEVPPDHGPPSGPKLSAGTLAFLWLLFVVLILVTFAAFFAFWPVGVVLALVTKAVGQAAFRGSIGN